MTGFNRDSWTSECHCLQRLFQILCVVIVGNALLVFLIMYLFVLFCEGPSLALFPLSPDAVVCTMSHPWSRLVHQRSLSLSSLFTASPPQGDSLQTPTQVAMHGGKFKAVLWVSAANNSESMVMHS